MERVLNPRPLAEALAEGSAASPSCLSSPFYTRRLFRTLQFDVVVCKWRLCNLTFLISSRSHTGMQWISGILFSASLSSSF